MGLGVSDRSKSVNNGFQSLANLNALNSTNPKRSYKPSTRSPIPKTWKRERKKSWKIEI